MTTPTASAAASVPEVGAAGCCYLDVAAVRIQTYLGRSRHLWGRRGASAVLAAVCQQEEIEGLAAELSEQLGTPVRPNPEAPAVDGVVSVIVDEPGRVAQVAEAIASWLSKQLPGLQVEARAAPGSSYLAAHEVAEAAAPVLEWLPAQLEYPPNRLCEECGQDAAVATDRIGGEDWRLCADCHYRRTWAEEGWPARPGPLRRRAVVTRSSGPVVGTFTVERRLMDELGVAAAVDDFGDLARLARRNHRNHLATVAADGNALGAFFAEARAAVSARAERGEATEEDRTALRTLSREVTKTTWQALLAATTEVYQPDDEHLPVIPHILGGDDVLVSVTADRTWRFVRRLLAAFAGDAVTSPLAAAATRLELQPPTLSVGVVISHASLPFGQQVTVSAALLEQAKRAVGGHGFSVAWLDTTAEGVSPLPGRRPLTAQELSAWAPGLDALAGSPVSAREALRREIATGDAVHAQQRLRARLRRHEPEVAVAVNAFLDGAGPNLLQAWYAEECVRVLSAGLSLARWW